MSPGGPTAAQRGWGRGGFPQGARGPWDGPVASECPLWCEDASRLCGRAPARSPVHQLKDRHVGGLLVWAVKNEASPQRNG